MIFLRAESVPLIFAFQLHLFITLSDQSNEDDQTGLHLYCLSSVPYVIMLIIIDLSCFVSFPL